MRLANLLAFLRSPIIMKLPPGMQGVDPGGGAGLLQAFMNNVNAHGIDGMQSYTTVGNAVVLVPQDILNGMVQFNTGATGGYNATLPATDAILAAMGPSVPQDGTFTSIIRLINNNSGQTATLTAGDGKTTIVGTATVATNVTRDYAMRVGPGSTLTFSNTGSLTL